MYIYFFAIFLLDEGKIMTNILGNVKNFAELKNPINYFIHKMIHHSV